MDDDADVRVEEDVESVGNGAGSVQSNRWVNAVEPEGSVTCLNKHTAPFEIACSSSSTASLASVSRDLQYVQNVAGQIAEQLRGTQGVACVVEGEVGNVLEQLRSVLRLVVSKAAEENRRRSPRLLASSSSSASNSAIAVHTPAIVPAATAAVAIEFEEETDEVADAVAKLLQKKGKLTISEAIAKVAEQMSMSVHTVKKRYYERGASETRFNAALKKDEEEALVAAILYLDMLHLPIAIKDIKNLVAALCPGKAVSKSWASRFVVRQRQAGILSSRTARSLSEGRGSTVTQVTDAMDFADGFENYLLKTGKPPQQGYLQRRRNPVHVLGGEGCHHAANRCR